MNQDDESVHNDGEQTYESPKEGGNNELDSNNIELIM